MRYLIGTKEYIDGVNRAEGAAKGCNGVTKFWYDVRKTNLGMSVLMIDDDKPIPGSVTLEPVWEVISTVP